MNKVLEHLPGPDHREAFGSIVEAATLLTANDGALFNDVNQADGMINQSFVGGSHRVTFEDLERALATSP